MKTIRRFRSWLVALGAMLLAAGNACAQPPIPILVADINTGNGPVVGSDPGSYARLNATQTVFAAFDPVHGRELWITDGTPAGTSLLFDFCPGACSSDPIPLNAANALARGLLYISADDGASGAELWKVSSAGVVSFIKDINPGPLGSQPSRMAFPGNSATSPGFFAATSAATGNELWKSDGTAAGTLLVKDLNPGTAGSFPGGFGEGLNRVYFSASEPTTGRELYMSDGTSAGTVLRADIQPGPGSSSPNSLVEIINDTMIFTADDGVAGRELWITTPTNTTLFKDIAPGADSSSPSHLINFNGRIYFSASSAGNFSDEELWRSDGTAFNTVPLMDICPGGCSSNPRHFAKLNTSAGTRLLFFAETSAATTAKLFVSDGTVAGTLQIFDTGVVNPLDLAISGSLAYFTDTTDRKLFRTNGTGVGTFLLRDFANDNFLDIAHFEFGPTGANRILLAADDGFIGNEFYVAGPSAGPASLLKNIAPDLGYSNPLELTNLNGTLYFSAFSETTGRELWKVVDPATGAALVTDLIPGAIGSNPSQLTVFNGKLYFAAQQSSVSFFELYVSDGTQAGTHPLKDLGSGVILEYRNCLTVAGNRFYFNAVRSDGGASGPWISDGTDAGTQDMSPGAGVSNGHCLSGQPGFANAGSDVLFDASDSSRGKELFRSDGTPAGTALVRDIVTGAESADPQRFVSLGSRACFTVTQGANFNLDDEEPWCSDGTAQGTLPLGDLNPGGDSSQPRSFTRIGPWLVFSAFSPPMLDRRLWRSDGTSTGTVALLPNVRLGASLVGFPTRSFPGGNAPDPLPLEHDGTFVYFACFGTKLCRQDIRPGNELTVQSDNFPVGPDAGGIDQLHVFPGGDALLSCADAVSGRELCRFRAGSLTDDIAIVDIAPGAASSSPEQITPAGDFIYFTADDGTHGRELWAVPLKDTIDRIFADKFE